ncbi:MAG: carboxylating nicotinate-nucleotide diphosphorylase [Desulfobacterales bacterium]|nr:carboxylating nicotinate-nucleotide diphosphorylase [Desulfobacterales bacterium]
MHTIQDLIDLALAEDIGTGDITTDAVVSSESTGRGKIVAKEEMILAGLDVTRQVFLRLDPQTRFATACHDGDRASAGQTVMEIEGRLTVLLQGERTALNFLQRLSGMATHVRRFVDILGDRPVRLVDTRKTTPGWRVLEKYAVRVGGAHNHRVGLYDGVLIKDNHIAACGGITAAVERVRRRVSHLVRIEVETANMDQVEEALAAGAEVIMLDNMDLAAIRRAVTTIAGRAQVEVSGNVTAKTLTPLADTGVDIISVGALTHQATSVDLSMRIDP